MDAEQDAPPKTARPFFIPASVDFAKLPPELQAALTEIVGPAYESLVLRAGTLLERSAGLSLTFLLSLEIVDQYQLGRQLAMAAAGTLSNPEARAELIASYLRLVRSKQTQADFLFRLQSAYAKFGRHF